MNTVGCWLHRILFRSLGAGVLCALAGAVIAAVIVVPIVSRPQPVIVEDLHEADGIVARGGQIDLMGIRTGASTCPGATQRYLWRKVEMNGKEVTQLVPLPMTVLPAYVPNGPTLITLPVPITVPDGKWFYRAVTLESCSWLPAWLGGATVRRTADVPVEVRG